MKFKLLKQSIKKYEIVTLQIFFTKIQVVKDTPLFVKKVTLLYKKVT